MRVSTILILFQGESSASSGEDTPQEAIQQNTFHSLEEDLPQQPDHQHAFPRGVEATQEEPQVEKVPQSHQFCSLGRREI